MNKICCYTGHRPKKFTFQYNEQHPDCIKIKTLIRQETEKAIKDGYDYFISGMALGVDMWAAEAVLELKKKYPHIKLESAVPCLNQERTWPVPFQQRYRNILNQADVVNYVNKEAYQPYLMIQRDKYMVDKSSMLIAVFDGSKGGTKHTFDYALEKGIYIIRIDPIAWAVTNIQKEKQMENEQFTLFNLKNKTLK